MISLSLRGAVESAPASPSDCKKSNTGRAASPPIFACESRLMPCGPRMRSACGLAFTIALTTSNWPSIAAEKKGGREPLALGTRQSLLVTCEPITPPFPQVLERKQIPQKEAQPGPISTDFDATTNLARNTSQAQRPVRECSERSYGASEFARSLCQEN